MANIVVIGSLNMDLIALTARLPMGGETILGTSYLTEHGGKGGNQAYAAARLGGDVAMLGRVGSDEFGKRLRDGLNAVRCDVRGVRQSEGNSGIAIILVAKSGQNSIVVIPGANHRYLPSDLNDDIGYLAGAKYVLLQLETPIATVIAAAQAAKREGAQVILDPAPAPDEVPLELFRSIDVVTPNETEATKLVGHEASALSNDDALSIARRLQGYGTKTVIIKLGERGCILVSGDMIESVPAPLVSVVDTTAAGDVFNAAFAVACTEGASLADACRFAVRAAAISVTRLGAQSSIPDRAEISRIDSYLVRAH